MNLSNHTLNQVNEMYRQGSIGYKDVTEYLISWNAGPHFTQAVLSDGKIRNFDPEKSGVFYRHLKDIFGLHL
jgi:hypothetical protein